MFQGRDCIQRKALSHPPKTVETGEGSEYQVNGSCNFLHLGPVRRGGGKEHSRGRPLSRKGEL